MSNKITEKETSSREEKFLKEYQAISSMNISEYINKYEYIAKFFTKKHKYTSSLMTYEDIYSYAIECLLIIKDDYSPHKNSSFRNFAIKKIHWFILDRMREHKEDLRRGGKIPIQLGEDKGGVISNMSHTPDLSVYTDSNILLSILNEKERFVVTERLFKDRTFNEISKTLKITYQGVFMIYDTCLKKMRRYSSEGI